MKGGPGETRLLAGAAKLRGRNTTADERLSEPLLAIAQLGLIGSRGLLRPRPQRLFDRCGQRFIRPDDPWFPAALIFVIIPSGTRPAQSHSTSRGSNWTVHVILTPRSGSAASGGGATTAAGLSGGPAGRAEGCCMGNSAGSSGSVSAHACPLRPARNSFQMACRSETLAASSRSASGRKPGEARLRSYPRPGGLCPQPASLANKRASEPNMSIHRYRSAASDRSAANSYAKPSAQTRRPMSFRGHVAAVGSMLHPPDVHNLSDNHA